jgi:hypothetical protein
MGFLDRRRRSSRALGKVAVDALMLEDGDELVAVVGESNYQAAIRAACGARRGEAVSFDCVATLICEPDNQFDRNAIAIYAVNGGKVGYLSRGDAVDYGPAARAATDAGLAIACHARISGRGRAGDTANLGVFLKLPLPDRALAEVTAST